MINPSSYQTPATGLINAGIMKAIIFACFIFVGWKGAAGNHHAPGNRSAHPYILETGDDYPSGIQAAVNAAESSQTIVIPKGYISEAGFTTAGAAPGINIRLGYPEPACIYINSDVTLVHGNNLYVDIGGTQPCLGHIESQYDILVLENDASISLGGANLVINLLDGFEPQPGDIFNIIVSNTKNGITGTFSNGQIIKAQNFYFYIQYNNMITLPDNSTGYAVSLTAVAPMFRLEIINAGKNLN